MRTKFNKKQFVVGLMIGLVGIPLALTLAFGVWDAYDAYRDRQHSVTITGPVEIWEHRDLYHHQDSRVIAVLEKGAAVKVLRFETGIDWASIRVRLADGREGYINGFGPDPKNYVLR